MGQSRVLRGIPACQFSVFSRTGILPVISCANRVAVFPVATGLSAGRTDQAAVGALLAAPSYALPGFGRTHGCAPYTDINDLTENALRPLEENVAPKGRMRHTDEFVMPNRPARNNYDRTICRARPAVALCWPGDRLTDQAAVGAGLPLPGKGAANSRAVVPSNRRNSLNIMSAESRCIDGSQLYDAYWLHAEWARPLRQKL